MSEPPSTADETQAAQAVASDTGPGGSSHHGSGRRTSGMGSQHSTRSMRRLSTNIGQSARSFRRRSSEIFASTLAMFRRTGGEKGASVEMLRGDSGSAFEGHATVQRGEAPLGFWNPCSCFRKRGDRPRFLLIKGYHCFVYDPDDSSSPRYAIELVNRGAVVQRQPGHHHRAEGGEEGAPPSSRTSVRLETSLGDVEYRMTFATAALASRFVDAVAVASSEASADQVRTRLGHGGLLNKRASVRFAQAVGTAKARDQPEAPVSAVEIMAGMPTPMVGYN